jgi:site-specific DNA recombinase
VLPIEFSHISNNGARSESLLTGRIYDDRGSRMSPSHSRKVGIKYRYLKSPLLHDSLGVPAPYAVFRLRAPGPGAEVEALVASAFREHLDDSIESDDQDLIRSRVVCLEVHLDQLAIEINRHPAIRPTR